MYIRHHFHLTRGFIVEIFILGKTHGHEMQQVMYLTRYNNYCICHVRTVFMGIITYMTIYCQIPKIMNISFI